MDEGHTAEEPVTEEKICEPEEIKNVMLNTSKSYSLVSYEYSKFRIKSNSCFSIRFDLKRAQLFEIFEYLPSLIFYSFG